MIIDDLHIFGASFCPPKANAPLIIDTNAVLPGSLAFEGFKAIARWHFQIVQSGDDFELPQLSPRHCSEIYEPSDADALGECFGIRTLERSDHGVY